MSYQYCDAYNGVEFETSRNGAKQNVQTVP